VTLVAASSQQASPVAQQAACSTQQAGVAAVTFVEVSPQQASPVSQHGAPSRQQAFVSQQALPSSQQAMPSPQQPRLACEAFSAAQAVATNSAPTASKLPAKATKVLVNMSISPIALRSEKQNLEQRSVDSRARVR
jgi:hypothetical protein